ncbi:ALQxL family class IV lanthipeptide [Actinacidiphila alni]
MELDLDSLQVLPGDEETAAQICTWTCSSNTCRDTCIATG